MLAELQRSRLAGDAAAHTEATAALRAKGIARPDRWAETYIPTVVVD